MDGKTQATLAKIAANVPLELAKNVTKVEVDDSENQLAEAALNAKFISEDKKKVIEEKMEQGAFIRKEEVVNDEAGEAIGEYHAREIARAKEQGALADPMSDPFFRKRMEHVKAIQTGQITPNRVTPLSDGEKREAIQRMSFDRSGDPHRKKYY